MNRSQIFAAAHAEAAKKENFAIIYSYRQRFAFALKAAYAAARNPKQAGEATYTLLQADYFGGNHAAPMTWSEICAAAEAERAGASALLTKGLGGHAAYLYDMGSCFARLAA